MKRSLVLSMIILGVFILSTVGSAQEFYLGVKFGLSMQSPKSGDEDFEYKVDTRTLYGFRLGLRVSQFAVEGVYTTSDHYLNPKEDAPDDLQRERFGFSNTGVNALYFFPIPVVEPYVSLGYGSYKAVIADMAESRSGGINAGVGAAAKMGQYVSAAAEVRYHSVAFTFDDRQIDVSDWAWNVSFNFHFNFLDM
jgi:hypothetical protein